MRKINFFFSILLIFIIPPMILFLSSNLALRVPMTYSFHFNDSEVIYDIPYNVTVNDMAEEIASYWSSFDSKPFQVYEDNRIFKDPIFEKDEQEAMERAKETINLELAAGLILLALSLSIYIYFLKKGFKKALRNRCGISLILTVCLLIGQIAAFCQSPFRIWLYGRSIGVSLHKGSILATILGAPFFKTYLIFASIAGAALLGVITYIHFKLTKPETIFH